MKYPLLFACVLLGLLTAATLTVRNSVLARPENWSRVATFTGLASRNYQTTPYFNVDHADWRSRWEYALDPGNATGAGFIVWVYRMGESHYIDYFYGFGPSQTNGTSYVNNQTGTFYMSILAGQPGILNYTIIVEQDLDSVPELPSSTVILLTLATTLLVMIAFVHRKQRVNTPKEG